MIKKDELLKDALNEQTDDNGSLENNFETKFSLDEFKSLEKDNDSINASESDSQSMTSSYMKHADSSASLSLDKLSLDYNSIELNWKSSRKNCNCFEPFDFVSSKLNCSRCGEIYCERCVENGKYILSQVSTKLVFVCDICLKRFPIE